MAPRVGTNSVALLYLFLAFQLVNQIFLPILVATFLLSKSVKRHSTVVNICVTWIISGTISSLLLYAGKQVGPEPPKMLCVSQATLLDGVPPMNSVAILALMNQVNLSIRKPKAKSQTIRTSALLIAPYLSFFAFAISAAFLAVQRPQAVNRARRFFYCSFDSPISNAFAVFTALALLGALGYAVAIGVFLRKNWRALRQAGSLDLQFLGRVALFVVYIFLTLVLSGLSIIAPRNPFPDLFTASAGTMLALILSTQPDVYRAWLRRSRPTPPRFIDDWVSLDLEKFNIKKVRALEDGHVARDDRVVDISPALNALRDNPESRQRQSLGDDVTGPESDQKEVDIATGHDFQSRGKS